MDELEETKRKHAAETFGKVTKSLSKESERGSVILAASHFDELLTRVISKYLVPTKKEDLLIIGGPLGDFGAKINLAFRLGLIPKSIVRSLDICRKLRNDFAHLSVDISFETPRVKDRIAELLSLNANTLSVMGEVLKENGLQPFSTAADKISPKYMLEHMGTAQLFYCTCGFIASGMAILFHSIEPLTERLGSDN